MNVFFVNLIKSNLLDHILQKVRDERERTLF